MEPLPRITPTHISQRTSENGIRIVYSIDLRVRYAVPVWVPFECPHPRNIHVLVMCEQFGARDLHDGPVPLEPGRVLAGQYHSLWAPGELVSPGIGIRLGGGQAAAVGDETLDPTSLAVDLIYHPLGLHVVDPRVQSHLVQKQDPRVLCLGVKRSHPIADVGGGDHVDPRLDGRFGDIDVKCVWEQ